MAYRHSTQNTDWDNRPSPEFAATNRRVIVGPLSKGRLTWVYVPSQEAQEWDGVSASHALGSRFGGYSYARIEVSGRKDRYFPGYDRPLRKLRVTVAVDTEDEETVEGWLIGGGDSL